MDAASTSTAPMPAPAPRESVVLFVRTATAHALIIRTIARRTTQLVSIEPVTGLLGFTFTPGGDVFASEAAALEHLRDAGPVEVLATAKVVLGYVVIGPVALLLLAEKLRVSATLPGNHEVKTVTSSKWYRIQLQQPEPDPITAKAMRDEMDQGIAKTMSFPIDGAHYFCETFDLSRPFPSDRPAPQPSWEFVWNRWLTTGFRTTGLDFVCPQLLQGMCESRELEDFDGARYNLALVSRRGRLHVGPRYKARGLNHDAEPGNEIECEQIIWRTPRNNKESITWSRYTWRRGSVPLWWGVSIKNSGIGEAEIKIRPTNTFEGSRRYVRRLQKRYTPNPHLDPDPPALPNGATPADRSLSVPVVFVSLLRKGTPDKDRSETKLASAFDFVVGALRKEHQLPLTYIALDWHELDRQLGHEGIVEAFWACLRGILPQHGFALGTMTKVADDWSDLAGKPVTPDELALGPAVPSSRLLHERCSSPAGLGWVVRWFRQQRGVARYNCADSLDRTNVGSFFGAAQVMVEQCRELDIGIASAPRGAATLAQLSALRSRHLAALAAAGGQTGGPGGAGAYGTGGPGGNVQLKTGFAALEKFGKELNKSLTNIMQDLKSPKMLSGQDLRTVSAPIHNLFVRAAPHALPAQPALQAADLPALPEGWEAKLDKATQRIFYVDHNRKTTSWERPPPPPPPLRPPASDSPPLPSSSPFPDGVPQSASAPVTPGRTGPPTPAGTPVPVSPQTSIPFPAQLPCEDLLGDPVGLDPPAGTLQGDLLGGAVETVDDGAADLLGGFALASDLGCLPTEGPTTTEGEQTSRCAADMSGPNPGFASDTAAGVLGRAGGIRLTSAVLHHGVASTSEADRPPSPCSNLSHLSLGDMDWPPRAEGASQAANGTNGSEGPAGRPADQSLATMPTPSPSAVACPPAATSRLPSAVPRDNSDLSRLLQRPAGSLPGTDAAGGVADLEQWEPLTPWCLLPTTVKKFGRRVKLEALSALAELFLVNGDMSAWLYTGSQAMHSERILIFEPETSKLRRAGIGSYGNSLIAIKRRYNNVLVDSDKQMQIEIFLGMKHHVYFPSLYLAYKDTPQVPLDHRESDDDANDIVARIDWPVPDKGRASDGPSELAAAAAAVTAGLGATGASGSSATPGSVPATGRSSHGRGKSFSSEKLLEELHRSSQSAHRPSGTPNSPKSHLAGVAAGSGAAGSAASTLAAVVSGEVLPVGDPVAWQGVGKNHSDHRADGGTTLTSAVMASGNGSGHCNVGNGSSTTTIHRSHSTDQLACTIRGSTGGAGSSGNLLHQYSSGLAGGTPSSFNAAAAQQRGAQTPERTSAGQRTASMVAAMKSGVRKFTDPLGLL